MTILTFSLFGLPIYDKESSVEAGRLDQPIYIEKYDGWMPRPYEADGRTRVFTIPHHSFAPADAGGTELACFEFFDTPIDEYGRRYKECTGYPKSLDILPDPTRVTAGKGLFSFQDSATEVYGDKLFFSAFLDENTIDNQGHPAAKNAYGNKRFSYLVCWDMRNDDFCNFQVPAGEFAETGPWPRNTLLPKGIMSNYFANAPKIINGRIYTMVLAGQRVYCRDIRGAQPQPCWGNDLNQSKVLPYVRGTVVGNGPSEAQLITSGTVTENYNFIVQNNKLLFGAVLHGLEANSYPRYCFDLATNDACAPNVPEMDKVNHTQKTNAKFLRGAEEDRSSNVEIGNRIYFYNKTHIDVYGKLQLGITCWEFNPDGNGQRVCPGFCRAQRYDGPPENRVIWSTERCIQEYGSGNAEFTDFAATPYGMTHYRGCLYIGADHPPTFFSLGVVTGSAPCQSDLPDAPPTWFTAKGSIAYSSKRFDKVATGNNADLKPDVAQKTFSNTVVTSRTGQGQFFTVDGNTNVSSYGNTIYNYQDSNVDSVNIYDDINLSFAGNVTKATIPFGSGNISALAPNTIHKHTGPLILNYDNVLGKKKLVIMNDGDVTINLSGNGNGDNSVVVIAKGNVTINNSSGDKLIDLGIIATGTVSYPSGDGYKIIQNGFVYTTKNVKIQNVNSSDPYTPSVDIRYSAYYMTDFREFFDYKDYNIEFVGFTY